jgi:hypothetical protein
MTRLLFLLTLLAALITSALAQSENAFTYQFVAKSERGIPYRNLVIQVRATIVVDSLGDKMIYREIHEIYTDRNGMVNLPIGLGRTIYGNFSSIDWNTGQKFLKIEIDETLKERFRGIGVQALKSTTKDNTKAPITEQGNNITVVKGDVGYTGMTGPTGATGATGKNGQEGEPGVKGDKGEKGVYGDTGPTGPTGPPGEKGEKGIIGNTGITGPTGANGKDGAGNSGQAGNQGERGERGIKGDTGITGPTGSTGSAGKDGLSSEGKLGGKGEKGDKG